LIFNGAGSVYDQKTSKFFVSRGEESIFVNGVYEKLGERNTKESMVGPRWSLESERTCFSSSGAFKT
jgi:hypothetical protein